MTVVYVPQPPHTCDVGPQEPCHDAPGTTRRCACGRFWVAEKYPEVRGGQQRVGVFWRPEKARERRRREKSHRAARMAPPASAKGPLRAPPTVSETDGGLAVPEIRHDGLVRICGLEGRWRVNDLAQMDGAGAWHFKLEPVP